MNRPWTTTELAYLRDNRELGAAVLAELMDRSPALRAARRSAASRLASPAARRARSPLRRSSPPVCLEELRAAVSEAPAHYSARMDERREAELCCECGHRPVQVARAGLCGPCYARVMACRARDARDELEQVKLLLAELIEEYGTALDLPRLAAQMRSRRSRARLREGA